MILAKTAPRKQTLTPADNQFPLLIVTTTLELLAVPHDLQSLAEDVRNLSLAALAFGGVFYYLFPACMFEHKSRTSHPIPSLISDQWRADSLQQAGLVTVYYTAATLVFWVVGRVVTNELWDGVDSHGMLRV